MRCCIEEADFVSQLLNIPSDSVLVASTGVIGRQMPVDKLKNGIQLLIQQKGNSVDHGQLAAEAIMTTDTIAKQIAVVFEIDGVEVTIGGMCKGSGMIHPNMCTMLSFVTTDVDISKELLQEAVSNNVTDTYNMI